MIETFPDGHTEYRDVGDLLNIASLLHGTEALTKLQAATTEVKLRIFFKEAINAEIAK